MSLCPVSVCICCYFDSIRKNLIELLETIKIEHSLFILPFALISTITIVNSRISCHKLALVVMAIVIARTSAMIFNRIIDINIDRINPRTSNRSLPAGRLRLCYMILLLIIIILLFGYVVNLIGRLPYKLMPVLLFIIFSYSYCKRFTFLSHLILGFSLSLMPISVSIAIDYVISPLCFVLSAGICFWVVGFDIIYSLQDIDFDKQWKLYSIPAYFGMKRALIFSKISYFTAIILWFLFVLFIGIYFCTWLALSIISILLFMEHRMINEYGTDYINYVFFNINRLISAIFFLGCFLDYVIYSILV